MYAQNHNSVNISQVFVTTANISVNDLSLTLSAIDSNLMHTDQGWKVGEHGACGKVGKQIFNLTKIIKLLSIKHIWHIVENPKQICAFYHSH